MTASPLIASYLRRCPGTAKVVKHRDIILRIRALASSSVIAPPFKTFSVRFKICSQLLSIVKHTFFNPPTAWPGLAFVIPYVSYVIEIFVFDNRNISMHISMHLCWLL